MIWTVGKLIQWSKKYLEEKGIDTPLLDSEVLLAHALNIERTSLYLDPHRPLSQSEYQNYKKLIERRALREPVSYIAEIKEFWSLRFKVNRHVLIPRPETEILIQKALEILKGSFFNYKRLVYVNDIGTGSGNIAISLSKEWDNLHIVATDNSEEALAVARENAQLNHAGNQLCFQNRELFGEIKTGKDKTKFDLIISNPPYIPSSEIETLAPEIKNYEPIMALDGGPDGLSFYRKIISEAPNYLAKDGFIIFEIGYNQGKAITELLSKKGNFSEIAIAKDYSGNERVISARYIK